MWKIVEQYQLAWRAKDNVGIIYLFFSDGSLESIQPDSIQELDALGNILRNEKPIWFHTTSKDLTTGREPTGELELP